MIIEVSIDSFLGWHSGEILLVKSVRLHRPVLNLHLTALEVRNAGIGMHHEVFVVSVREIVSRMCPSGLLAVEARVDGLTGLYCIGEKLPRRFSSYRV